MSDQAGQARVLLSDEREARSYVERWADPAAMERLAAFSGMLLSENKQQNLVSKSSEDALWLRHFADSAQLLEHVPRETLPGAGDPPWLDLGTGAGFPGLVIAALRPQTPVVLVESRTRRAEFLRQCAASLGLDRCMVIADRIERIEAFPATVISARAFAPLDKLLRLSAPFSTKHTRYLLPKGRSAAHELAGQKSSIRRMFHVEPSLTDRDAGIIVRSQVS